MSARTFEYDSSPRARASDNCAWVQPHPPCQPRGARAEPAAPAAAGVERADEVEQAGGGGVEMGGQLGDLVTQPIKLRGRRDGHDKRGGRDGDAGSTKVGVHQRILLLLRRLYTPIFDGPGRLQNARSSADSSISRAAGRS